MKTIIDLLESEWAWVQGNNTRIIRLGEGTRVEFLVLAKKLAGGSYKIELYRGQDEAAAVQAFKDNETK